MRGDRNHDGAQEEAVLQIELEASDHLGAPTARTHLQMLSRLLLIMQ